jgi:hypothetical protein
MGKYHEKNPSDVYEKFHGIPWKIFHGIEMENSMN